MKRIGFDVDGVLADFDRAFLAEAAELLKSPSLLGAEGNKTEYGWNQYMSKEECSRVWSKVLNRENFWADMPVCPGIGLKEFTRISDLTWKHEVFFVTNRMHNTHPAAVQTHRWLARQGIHYPNVVLSKLKGEAAKALALDYYIDDKLENVWCAHWMSPGTKVFMLNRPWNQLAQPSYGPRTVQRLDTLPEFLAILEGLR